LSLADAFRLRRTEREFSDKPLSPQMLSDLLWAACGINRRNGPFGGTGRTAASASNSQEVETPHQTSCVTSSFLAPSVATEQDISHLSQWS